MSIAEKLTTVAENVPKIYKAGQSSMVDESKIIEKTVSGAHISVDDVSEIPHIVGCKVSGVDDLTNVKVTRCGKNLFDISSSRGFESIYGGLTNTINGDTLEVVCSATGRSGHLELGTFPKGTYTFSYGETFEMHQQISIGPDISNLTILDSAFYNNTKTFTLSNESKVWLSNSGFTKGNFSFSNIQVERNSSATEYEAFKKSDYTPKADGTVEGITSLSPYMNIFTDNAGVTLDITYRKSWGMQTEYDRFWDSYQNRYATAHFAGIGWNNDTFKPKYDIKITNGYFFFYNCGVNDDLVEILNRQGVSLDTSEATSIQYLFRISRFTRVGEINLTGLGRIRDNTIQAFSTSALITIDKMIVNENNVFATNMFTGATALKNIIIEGPVADSINFKDSPLSKDSILSVFNSLSDTITGKTLTLKLSAVNTAFETSAGAADGSTSEEWNTLISTKSNWTISLV